ncbi:MAG TPA: biopolymer transporter ExbD [Vicinamibacterales bacterium]|nr:biopolymer transporter ExbD [Vicinamibacterales bacterium]
MPKVQPAAAPSGNGRTRTRRVASSLAEINVVPLVDVMLVLLIIFMVTAPMIQHGIDVKLPISRRSAPMTSARIFVTVPVTFRRDRMVYLNDKRIPLDVLQERVRQALLGKSEKQVFLRGDGRVELQDLYTVMDQLKAAGVQNVGIVSKLPGER